MKAFIKKDKWDMFLKNKEEYGFLEENNDFYAKRIDPYLVVCVHKRKRELILVTRMGIAAFIEVHKEKYWELLNDDLIEFKKGKFD